jgi:uncharacterized membrane protein
MDNMFIASEFSTLCILGIPTIIYFVVSYKWECIQNEQLNEVISNYNLLTTLYSIFLSMALVTLLVNFNEVQEKTNNEGVAIISAARLMSGMNDTEGLKQALVNYAKSVVDYDLDAMHSGTMSNQAKIAFDNLWDQANKIKIHSNGDDSLRVLVLNELNEITKCRNTRAMRIKQNLHPLIFLLIIVGYYMMLVKSYFTRVKCRKSQLAFDISMFLILLLIITVIIDLDTPFVGIVNIDTSAFNLALEKVSLITKLTPN